ncbi:MAG: hypothetical protein KAY21_10935 [Limnohabitans sp.]|nr:hypothetical protein [Limnohabitans sp.]
MPASPAQLPFKEAIDFFKNKISLPSAGWTDIWKQQHSLAFVVAGAQSDALLGDFYTALKTAQEKGTGYAAFRDEFDAIVARHKWAHNGTPGWRSRIIYDTNMTQAYNTGRWQQMWALREQRPFLRYRHTSFENPRLEHKAWDGKVLPITDPWWNTHTPQNGWGCKCRVDSLSRGEAQADWSARGRTGPDEAPPLDMQEVTVGKTSATPRTVLTPKGIDPGFAYNPGKAYLEPHTVPPLQGYESVLKERQGQWPAGMVRPPVPTPKRMPTSALNPPDMDPAEAVARHLDIFGASLEQGAIFEDVTGSHITVSKALFIAGPDKVNGPFKWIKSPGKAGRIEDLNLLAYTLADPDEVWWHWSPDWSPEGRATGRWRLKRRYIKVFEVDGKEQAGVAIFEWGDNGWAGATTFTPDTMGYLDKVRLGKLVHQKKTAP